MMIGTKAIAQQYGIPMFSVMRLYKTGVIPGISIGQGRGSKLLFDPDLVADALKRYMLDEQEQRKVICAEE
jgi:hypothetical protein